MIMSEKFKKIITLLVRQDVPFHIEKKPIAYCACGDGKKPWEIIDAPYDVYFHTEPKGFQYYAEELSYVISAMKNS